MHRRRAKAEVDGGRREALLVKGRATCEDVDVVCAPIHIRRRAAGQLAKRLPEDGLPVVHRLVFVVYYDGRARLCGAHSTDERCEQRKGRAAVGRTKVGDVERRLVRRARLCSRR